MNRIIAAAALASAAIAAPAVAAPPKAAEYHVELTMREAGKVVLAPSLLVRAGDPAVFMKGDDSRWLKVTAAPQEDGRVHLSFDSVVTTAKGLRHDGSMKTVEANGAPTILAAAGSGGTQSGALEVEVRVRPTGR
jgi:hypothetical protein